MKKILRFLSACITLMLVLGCTVSTSFADDTAVTDEAVVNFVQSVVDEIISQSDEDLQASVSMYDAYGYTAIADGFRSYLSIKDTLGDFQSAGTPVTTYQEDGTPLVTTPLSFSQKTVEMIFTIDGEGYMSSFYFREMQAEQGSLGSKLKEAGINLVVGMGTVFLVLIFLCWIISLFKNISLIEKRLADRRLAGKENASVPEKGSEPVLAFVPDNASDDEIQAVIAAAIAAYESENGCTIEKQASLNNGLTIKTYRRK